MPVHECSIVELLLLLSLKKLTDKELPPPHTLRMALREYAGFVSQKDCAKYDYPKVSVAEIWPRLRFQPRLCTSPRRWLPAWPLRFRLYFRLCCLLTVISPLTSLPLSLPYLTFPVLALQALLIKSFEHICSFGLVTATREPRHRGMATEQLPLRLTVDPSSLYEFMSNNRDNYPLEVVRFGTQATL